MESSTAQSATSPVFRLRSSSGTTRSAASVESMHESYPGRHQENQAERYTSCSKYPERSTSYMDQSGRDLRLHHRPESRDRSTSHQSHTAHLERPATCASPAERCHIYGTRVDSAHTLCSRSTTSWFARDLRPTQCALDCIFEQPQCTPHKEPRRDSCDDKIPPWFHTAGFLAACIQPRFARHSAVSCTAACHLRMPYTAFLGALRAEHTLPTFHTVVVRASTDMITSDAGAEL